MKNLKITLCMVVLAVLGVSAQKTKNNTFHLSPEMVKIYDFETSTKGVHYEYQFEDDYTVKLTNKAYKISLFFEDGQIEAVQKAVSKVLDDNRTSSGFKTMVWKKTAHDGKPTYKVELKNNKLRIELTRKNSDETVYKTLSTLGQEFIKAINS
ncbi:MAG: hypothetical protein ABJN95_04165 [Maribacter sp.]|uniref:hypothetical protein n=1 Tax=Maribacter sp. TaxID=1897614 RepID=UPI003299ED5A